MSLAGSRPIKLAIIDSNGLSAVSAADNPALEVCYGADVLLRDHFEAAEVQAGENGDGCAGIEA